MLKMEIKITENQYFEIKALYNAASSDLSYRLALTMLYYDNEKKWIVGADGRIMRMYRIDFKTDKSFCIPQRNFLLTKTQFRKIYAYDVPQKAYSSQKYDIEISIDEESKYPKYKQVINEKPVKYPHSYTIVDIDLFQRFNRTYIPGSPRLKPFYMVPTSKLGAINIYNDDGELQGVIMPCRKFSDMNEDEVIFGIAKGKEKCSE